MQFNLARINIIFLVLTFIASAFYVFLQVQRYSNVTDALFTGMLMGNTFIIARLTSFIEKKIQALDIRSELVLGFSLYKNVYQRSTHIITAIAFSVIFFAVTLVIQPIDDSILNFGLAVLLGAANLITGYAASCLLSYVLYGYDAAKKFKIQLWDRSCELLSGFFIINDWVVKSVAVIGCVGIINAMLSQFHIGAPIYAFCAFSLICAISAYLFPLMPLVTKLRREKFAHLSLLSSKIQTEYDLLLNESGVANQKAIEIEGLLKVYKEISLIRTFPPVGERTVNTAFVVTILTALPSLIDFSIKLYK